MFSGPSAGVPDARSTLLIGLFHLNLEVVGEARISMCMVDGLGHVTMAKGRARHTQDRFLSTLRGAAWSRRQAREAKQLGEIRVR